MTHVDRKFRLIENEKIRFVKKKKNLHNSHDVGEGGGEKQILKVI